MNQFDRPGFKGPTSFFRRLKRRLGFMFSLSAWNKIHTDEAPAAVGPYSQAASALILHSRVLFSSGQIPLDPATGTLVAGGIEEQTRQVLIHLDAILAAAAMDWSKVVKVTVYMTNLADFDAMNAVYAEHLGKHRPARSTVGVAALPKGAMIEIELVAVGA